MPVEHSIAYKHRWEQAICSAAVSYLFIYFLAIPVQPIISYSTEPMFDKFSGLIELQL